MPTTYKAPLRDLRFVYYELFDANVLTKLPGYEEATEDLVMTVAEEMGTICSEVLHPLYASGDQEGCHFENGQVRTPKGFKEAYKTLEEGGWTALAAPSEHGGQGLPETVAIIVGEMLCSANLPFSMYMFLGHGAIMALEHHASDEVKATFLPRMIAGKWAGTMCLTEPQAGTDLGLVRTYAVEDGEEVYKISGSKIFISAGDHDLTENIVHLVLARLPNAPPGIKGISLFVIPKMWEQAGRLVGNGVTCGAIEHKMGIKASSTCVINFDGAKGYLVGEPHRGMKAMFTFMNGARLHVGVQGLGLAELAYQNAVNFARQRLQGRALTGTKHPDKEADPIIVHPDVRRMLLTSRAIVEGSRALTAWLALELDHVHKSTDPVRREEADDLASLLTPVIKAFQTDLGFEATNHALQVGGGYGYCQDYGLEQIVRDCRITQIYEGTNGIQALDLVGRKLPMHTGRYLRRFFHPVQAFLEGEAGNAAMEEFVAPVAKAFERLQRATAWLAVEAMKNPDQAGAAATDYLHLFGYVAFGYLWARSAKIALAKSGGKDAAFYTAKLATARFYMQRLLPRSSTHFANLMAGSASTMDFAEDAF
jgi:butyryl-CoA dehydrogenase